MKRFYRDRIKSSGKYSFNVIIKESDLLIVCDKNLEEQAYLALEYARKKIEKYISAHPEFRDSLVPIDITGNHYEETQFKNNRLHQANPDFQKDSPENVIGSFENTYDSPKNTIGSLANTAGSYEDIAGSPENMAGSYEDIAGSPENSPGLQSGGNNRNKTGHPTVSTDSRTSPQIPQTTATQGNHFLHHLPVPDIIKTMADASRLYNVGPMAAVAGAVAGYVGEKLLQECIYIMVENGGDIFIKSDEPFTLAVWAGENSPFSGKLNLQIDPEGKPLGICTSSGMFGHSLSFGKADAVVTISPNPALADAAATAIANRIRTKEDVQPVADKEQEKGILEGLIIIKDDRAAMWGDFELV